MFAIMVPASLTDTYINILRIAPVRRIPGCGATYVMPSATVSTTTHPEDLDKSLKYMVSPAGFEPATY
jgi:hypothetical protein